MLQKLHSIIFKILNSNEIFFAQLSVKIKENIKAVQYDHITLHNRNQEK